MFLSTIFNLYFVFNSNNASIENYYGNPGNICIYYDSLEVFFYNFQTKYKSCFLKLSRPYFRRLLNILLLYPYQEESNIIPFLKGLKIYNRKFNLTVNMFGHGYPTMKNIIKDDKKYLILREWISIDKIQFIKDLMSNFQNYNYNKIFNVVRNDELFYFISLSSLIENMGLVYLRLLTEDPYYRKDYIFVRDFIVNSASFLHSVNTIYKMSLKEKMYMNVFRLFTIKNFKLLYIYKFAWMLSYNSLLEEINNSGRKFKLGSKNFKVQYSRIRGTNDLECINLTAFDLEIKNLFDFILKIDLDYKFRKKFKFLEIPKNLDIEDLQLMIRDFDKNDLLKFYTEDSLPVTDQVKFKDLTYFLNSLDIKVPETTNNLKLIRKKLFFITNKKIKEYFINMCWVAYSKDKIQTSGFVKFLIDKVDSLTTDKPRKKKARIA